MSRLAHRLLGTLTRFERCIAEGRAAAVAEGRAAEERRMRLVALAQRTPYNVADILDLCEQTDGDLDILERLMSLPSTLDIWQRVALWKLGESARPGLGEAAVRLSLRWHAMQAKARLPAVQSGIQPTRETSVHLWLAERIPTILRLQGPRYTGRHAIRGQ